MGQLIRKKVDSRIRNLIENGVKSAHRTFFVIIGDHGKDQVMYLHFMLSKARVAAKPSVLWCYKKELGFSSHKKKRMKQYQAQVKKGLRDPDADDPFELFIAGTDIRYCYYKESHKILGNTYGMCVLQDFEAMTPNLLARTIETVEGGGVCILLLRSMSSLKQLYTMTMDVHSRYRTQSHTDVINRFNERFMLSLGDNANCLIVDDELNVLPISSGKNVTPLPALEEKEPTDSELQLREMKDQLSENEPTCTLVGQAKTLDQAKAVQTFIDAIADKTLASTVTLTAARGRGKSAALGIALAAAVAFGYSNIFVTSPSPENLKTLFQFFFKALEALDFQEHMDYDIVQSTNPDFNKAIVRVNIYKDHRQTVQYIQPQDSHVLGQAELVVIDEAAAIPLPVVKKLLGPYLVFMASTINGYEGTGRSLSLKLIQQLREQSRGFGDSGSSETGQTSANSVGGRSLREIKLSEPIRYAQDDPIEEWLNKLLCLDAVNIPRLSSGCPDPKECEIYYVDRDALFSYHPVSEAFLQKMMSLYVSSHYKNTPNDLQLMSDAPAHHLFVLLPPVNENSQALPEPLAVVQVCLEGEITRDSVIASLKRGKRADGDLIPWTISQQFQDDDFASLSGARIVRIATHPDYTSMGYGSRAIELLTQYYEGNIANIEEDTDSESESRDISELGEESAAGETTLFDEKLEVKDVLKLPPLLLRLEEKKPPTLHWIGVSFGLTSSLLKFWRRSSFVPLYLRQTPNELTGEHTCIMMRSLEQSSISYDPKWLSSFADDFKRRFMTLLGYKFREFPIALSLSILEAVDKMKNEASNLLDPMTAEQVNAAFSPYDLKRLESYASNMLDYHVILDLIPQIAQHFFNHRMVSKLTSPTTAINENENEDAAEKEMKVEKFDKVTLSAVQRAILLGSGCQFKSMDDITKELKLPISQSLALFIRLIRKSTEFYRKVKMEHVQKEIEKDEKSGKVSSLTTNPLKKDAEIQEQWESTEQSLEEDLDEGAREKMEQLRKRQREMIDSLDLTQFEVAENEKEWEAAAGDLLKKKSGVVSVKNDNSTKHKKPKTSLSEVAAEGEKLMGKLKAKKKRSKMRK